MTATPPGPVVAPYRLAVVCLGNICRSPMANVILDSKVEAAGLDERIIVTSAGTGDWHVGNPMDDRAAAILTSAGYDPSRHRAKTFTRDWYAENDLLLAMDRSNRTDMIDLAPTVGSADKVRLFRSFDPKAREGDDEVPDPWTGGIEGFELVLDMVERTSEMLIRDIAARLAR